MYQVYCHARAYNYYAMSSTGITFYDSARAACTIHKVTCAVRDTIRASGVYDKLSKAGATVTGSVQVRQT